MHTPPCCGRSAASSDCRAMTRGGQPPPRARSSCAAIAIAPCSDVPHPTTVTGPEASRTAAASSATPSGGESSTDRASAGCAATISSMIHGGPSRSSGT